MPMRQMITPQEFCLKSWEPGLVSSLGWESRSIPGSGCGRIRHLDASSGILIFPDVLPRSDEPRKVLASFQVLPAVVNMRLA